MPPRPPGAIGPIGHHPSPGLPAVDLLLLAVAITSVSFSGPLVAQTAAPALAIAFWRNAMAAGVLIPIPLLTRLRPSSRRTHRDDHPPRRHRMNRRAIRLSLAAGTFLALHFGLWLPSLQLTSVASSIALSTTTPIWTLLILRARGHPAPRSAQLGAVLAFLGVLLLTGVDLSLTPTALLGDALALGGGIAMAGYLLLGEEVRRTAGTLAYTRLCYSTAAAVLLLACLISGQNLISYPAETWWKLLLLTACAQLAGHSLLNRVVRTLGVSITSTAVLLETPGAALIAALWLGQVPPLLAYPALLVILAGLALTIRGSRSPTPAPTPMQAPAVPAPRPPIAERSAPKGPVDR